MTRHSRFLPNALTSVLLALVLPLLAQARQSNAVIAEKMAPRVSRFFADDAARTAAEPSYALLSEPNAERPSPLAKVGTDFAVVPQFTNVGGKHAAIIDVPAGTSMYGTGEVTGPLLRNGRRVTAWNTDAYGYGEEAQSLYKSHPWVLCVRPDGTSIGILADTTYRCEIDTGYTNPNQVRFVADGPTFPVIVIERDGPAEVVQELARLTGTMPLPPKWALGYHQCRYSYYPEARAREIAKGFRDRHIPCDVIWYDIDYMEAFRIFTFDRAFFPDAKALNADLLKLGFHNVWMIDPGVKSRKERGPADRAQAELDADPASARDLRAKEVAAFEAMVADGTRRDVWVKRADGKTYEGEVWPGWCYFPDYTSPQVREWWSALYKPYMANGITGVWNDMNEPAVFNVKTKTMPEDNVHQGDPSMVAPNGKAQGEKSRGTHARYHNVYGLNMVRATREGIQAANPETRPFVLSRAVFIGGQKYAAGWSGDNSADWYHLENSIPMVLSMGLSGFPLYGPDIGGFAGNGDGKLFARWMGFGALLPFSRGHTGKGNIDKEPWAFGEEVEKTCREALNRRYRLMPYLYTLAYEASRTGMPIARPLFFADPKDPALRSEDDAFMLGSSVLIAAQVVPDASRTIAMPTGIWRPMMAAEDANLPRLYIRGGAIVPVGPQIEFVGQKPLDELHLWICLDDNGTASGTLYDDTGEGHGYQKGDYRLSTFSAAISGDELVVREVSHEGQRAQPWKSIKVEVMDAPGSAKKYKTIRIEK